MIPSLGIIISLYVISRYVELFSRVGIAAKVGLVILILVTLGMMNSFFHSNIAETSMVR